MAQPENTVNNTHPQSRPGTPPAPPYSPVTPVMSHSTLFPPPPAADSLLGPSSQSMPPPSQAPVFAPEPVPISESQNPDAIALRSSLSILQMQRQQALRDIRKLDELKQAAARDPETFSRELTSGRLKSATGDIMHPHPASDDGEETVDKHEKEEDAEDAEEEDNMQVDGVTGHQSAQSEAGKLGEIPTPQNVVRMPPINWAKYHIVGESLDELHEEQRRRPSPGEPRRETSAPVPPARNPEHFVAAPYRPFVDRLEPGSTTKGGNKRKHDQT